MAKMRKGVLIADYTERKKEEDRQKALREKHGIDDEQIKVVERSPAGTVYRATMDLVVRFFKAVLWIIVFALATTGVVLLVYPETRMDAIALLENLIGQIRAFM
jgi:hypothetical protein